ncbi:membrane protein [Arthrobacter phage Prairie]|uniref:Membrane protein n=2 Tax=Lilmacvirus TaxID=3425005 RepID=A0AA49BPI1_9CAUD|nr:membrane protein [Arthrobacter phage Prairie]UKH48314.1 membrane protein [Arthrobacter phage Lilmac1015]
MKFWPSAVLAALFVAIAAAISSLGEEAGRSLYLVALVALLVAGAGTTIFYALSARFWVYPQGRRLFTVLASLTLLIAFVFIGRFLPREITFGIGATLVLSLAFAIARMGLTMYADWRAAGARLNIHHKKETPS